MDLCHPLTLLLFSFLPFLPPTPLPRIVMLLLALFYPISFPIAMLLDCILGKDHGTFFRRAGVFSGVCWEVNYFHVTSSSPFIPPLSLPLSPSPFPPSSASLSPPSSPPPELRELVKLHGSKSHENEEPLTYDEVLIIKVTLSHTQVVATLSVVTVMCVLYCRVLWRCGTRQWPMQ